MIESITEGLTEGEGPGPMEEINPPTWTRGYIIMNWRKGKGWTRRELSTRSGITESGIVHVEQNTTNPTYESLAALCNALGQHLCELLKDPTPSNPPTEIH